MKFELQATTQFKSFLAMHFKLNLTWQIKHFIYKQFPFFVAMHCNHSISGRFKVPVTMQTIAGIYTFKVRVLAIPVVAAKMIK